VDLNEAIARSIREIGVGATAAAVKAAMDSYAPKRSECNRLRGSGALCGQTFGSDAELRQHEANVIHWEPLEANRELVFEVTIRDEATGDYEARTVQARNGLLAIDKAQQEIPRGWQAVSARLAEDVAGL